MGFLESLGINVDIASVGTAAAQGLGKLLILAVGVAIALGYYWYNDNKKSFNYKCVIWEKNLGNYDPVQTFPAKEVTLRGVPFWYIPKLGKLRAYQRYPSKRVGKKTAWFLKTEHGQLVNIGVSNFDEKLKSFNIDFESLSVMQQVGAANRKLINEAYNKQSKIERYLPYIAMGGLIILVGVFGYLYWDKATEFVTGLSSSVEANKELTKTNIEMMVKLDDLMTKYGLADSSGSLKGT